MCPTRRCGPTSRSATGKPRRDQRGGHARGGASLLHGPRLCRHVAKPRGLSCPRFDCHPRRVRVFVCRLGLGGRCRRQRTCAGRPGAESPRHIHNNNQRVWTRLIPCRCLLLEDGSCTVVPGYWSTSIFLGRFAPHGMRSPSCVTQFTFLERFRPARGFRGARPWGDSGAIGRG